MAEFTENQPTDFRQGADGEMDTRRKILIGEAVLAKVQRGDRSQGQLNDLLHSELMTDQDRALFDLQPPMSPCQLLGIHYTAIRQIMASDKSLNPYAYGSLFHDTDAEKRELNLLVDGEILTYFDIERAHEKLLVSLGISTNLVPSSGLSKK